MADLPTVQCAVCGRPVALLECWHDSCTMETVFRATCHGASETAAIPRHVMEEGKLNIVDAVAFRTPQIEAR